MPLVDAPRIARIASGALILGGVALVMASGGSAGGWVNTLHCTAQADAQSLDAQLAAAGSPMAGDGATFVREGLAHDIDPRLLVAIAAQETMLETYGPAQAIRNAFGLGPGIEFPDESDAIAMAARTLAGYARDGLVTLPLIGARWAPVGASNDPNGLNGGWPAGVGTFFATLGGDPTRPVQASAQDPAPVCAPAAATAAPAGAYVTGAPPVIPAVTPTDGPGVVVVWGGAPPADGAPALPGFTFPVAAPRGSPVRYRPAGGEGVMITSGTGVVVVAPIAGTLAIADRADGAAGIGFWVRGASGNRVGLSPLAAYDDGIREGTRVLAGQSLGRSTGTITVSWRRGAAPVPIHPMLAATRPSD